MPHEPALSLDEDETLDLIGLLQTEGIVQCLVEVARPSDVAVLGTCSSVLNRLLGDHDLWASLLMKQFDVALMEASTEREPKRSFAQRSVCARWALKLPTSPPRVLATPTARRLPIESLASIGAPTTSGTPSRRPPPLRHSSSWSPDSSATPNENAPPPRRRGLRQLPVNAATPVKQSHTFATTPMTRCSVARLRKGLQDILLSPCELMTACPERSGDWSEWTARVVCPDDGAALSGRELQLSLHYPPDEADVEGDEATAGLPCIRVVRPHVFHPNVDPKTGIVCARALSSRCSAVQLVREQLEGLASLMGRPVFGVPPLNRVAAAAWYGDRSELQRLSHGPEALARFTLGRSAGMSQEQDHAVGHGLVRVVTI
jgi:ubiquitin-protein ligase